MRFGICTTPENVALLARSGYDFAELPVVQSLRPEQPEASVLPSLRNQIGDMSIMPEAWYLFVPGEMRLVGDNVDTGRLERYLASACARAASLGGRVIVFGSGGARQIPPGFPRETARQQMTRALVLAAEAAAPHGLTIGLEPLNAAACNHINSVPEAVRYVRDACHPALGIVADLHHITQDNQPLDDVLTAGTLLAHAHVAGAGRRAPISDDIPALAAFFRVLKQASYAGRVSVEADWRDLALEAAETLDTLQRAWEAA